MGSEVLDPVLLDELWDFADPAGSEARLRSAAASAKGIAAQELATQVARSVGLQRRFDEAIQLLDRIDLDGDEQVPVVVVRVALERGRVLNSSGKPADAVPYFMDALTAAEGAGEDFLAIDAAHMLAIADPDRSLLWNKRALAMVEATDDRRSQRWEGALHNNIGWTLHGQGDFAQALTHFEGALRAYRQTGTPEQVRVAHWSVARTLRSLGRTDEALATQLRLHAEGAADGYIDEELGELYLASGRPDLAAPHFAHAAALLGADEWFATNERDRLARLQQLSRLS